MKRYKVGTCGYYDRVSAGENGQTLKTIAITEQLELNYGAECVRRVSSHIWKKHPFKFLFQLVNLARNSESILIFPDLNGVKVILPIFVLLRKFYKFKLFYIVIGAWLPICLSHRKSLAKKIASISGLFVETMTLKEQLSKLNINNTIIFPNFKRMEIVEENELQSAYDKPYNICFFSRVTKMKGIEDIIHVVKKLNEDKVILNFDIYGSIDHEYKEEFNKIIANFPIYIRYLGVVDGFKTVEVIKNYYLQIFPTLYRTEGHPGSILDSYFAGVPVIASKWNSWSDIIDDNITGLAFELGNIEELYSKLLYATENPNIIIDMKKNCTKRAIQFLPENVMPIMINALESEE